MKSCYCLYSANSRASQLWKQHRQTISKTGTHICLICQHITATPITNSELRGRWQRGHSAVHGCVSRRQREERKSGARASVCSQHGCALQVNAQVPPSPLSSEAAAGNLKPMMSSSESTGYWQSVRKCTQPKVNITQLLGLIVFTVAQLWWIKGLTDKVWYMCKGRQRVVTGEVSERGRWLDKDSTCGSKVGPFCLMCQFEWYVPHRAESLQSTTYLTT